LKKGKNIKLPNKKNVKIHYGTVDSLNLKSIYINLQTWAEPKIYSDNWQRVVSILNKTIKQTILEHLNTDIFEDNFISDMDLRSSGINIGKKSFLDLETTLYIKNKELTFQSKEIKENVKDLTNFIIDENFKSSKYFKFSLTKTNNVNQYNELNQI
jgi:hypothetical protein